MRALIATAALLVTSLALAQGHPAGGGGSTVPANVSASTLTITGQLNSGPGVFDGGLTAKAITGTTGTFTGAVTAGTLAVDGGLTAGAAQFTGNMAIDGGLNVGVANYVQIQGRDFGNANVYVNAVGQNSDISLNFTPQGNGTNNMLGPINVTAATNIAIQLGGNVVIYDAGSGKLGIKGWLGNGATNTNVAIDTAVAYTGAAQLLSVSNNGTKEVFVNANGTVFADGGFQFQDGTVQTTAATATTGTAAPTASTVVARDSSANIRANNYASNVTSTATSGGTLTLVVGSSEVQILTGTQAHTVVLPAANTLPQTGFHFFITNHSTGIVTVQDNSTAVVLAVPAATAVLFTCTSIGTAAGTWDGAVPGITALTANLVPFASSANALANSTMSWDNTNKTLTLAASSATGPLILNSTDTSGNNPTLIVKNTGGSNGLPVLQLFTGATATGQLIGFTSTAFGLRAGLNLDVASGQTVSYRVNGANVEYADSLGSHAIGYNCTGGTTQCGTASLSLGTTTVSVVSGCRAICTGTNTTGAVKCAVSSTTLTITDTISETASVNYLCF